jgi:hypothetical protein
MNEGTQSSGWLKQITVIFYQKSITNTSLMNTSAKRLDD